VSQKLSNYKKRQHGFAVVYSEAMFQRNFLLLFPPMEKVRKVAEYLKCGAVLHKREY